jgi:hypothetical protein
MIKIENVGIYGWKAAVRGMRNPMNSWDKDDIIIDEYGLVEIGENNLELMKNLVKAGSDHSKFMRMITVTLDITAPLYWWKEFDTYKIGTVRNSCSTMHKIHDKEFELSDFSHEYLIPEAVEFLEEIILNLNDMRMLHNEYDKYADRNPKIKGKKHCWQHIIQLLPSSYNQKATVQLNYAVLRNMYHSRKNHKLDCWRFFCEWIETLPYARELICDVD